MARKRSSGHGRGRSGLPPTTDIRAPKSAFALISSAVPPASDVAGMPGERLNLTQRRLTGDEVYGYQAYRNSEIPVPPGTALPKKGVGDHPQENPRREAGKGYGFLSNISRMARATNQSIRPLHTQRCLTSPRLPPMLGQGVSLSPVTVPLAAVAFASVAP